MNALLSLAMLAGFNDPCVQHIEQRNGIKIQTNAFDAKRCFITVGDSKFRGMEYRNYLFTTDGEIMVFNSLGDGPASTHTGARAFYLRPFKTSLGWRFAKNGDLEILLPSGALARFDREKADWVELTGGEVIVDPEVTRHNQGGVEIRYFDGFVIDSGFRFGGHPTSRMERKSSVRYRDGIECIVENKEVFYRDGDEHEWNLPDDKEFTAWYKQRCN
tara:strand:- start:4799 stop:5449 length:651 start_codon:yes stop_codon:yes gene_type:complete